MSIKVDRIGATTVRIGANAVASAFFNRVKDDITDDILALVDSLYCARLEKPAIIALLNLPTSAYRLLSPKPYFIKALTAFDMVIEELSILLPRVKNLLIAVPMFFTVLTMAAA